MLLAACATPYQPAVTVPMANPILHPDHVRSADGTRLPLSIWQPGGAPPRAVVLALHGFNDYRRSFEETGTYLAERGFAVYAYDQRGFGETHQAGLWHGAAVMTADARMVAALLRAHYPGLPLYLLGESMGGAVALQALADSAAGRVDGLVLLAPAVWGRETMPWLQQGALWLAAHTFPAAKVTARGLGIRATDSDAARQKLRQDPLVIKATRVDALWGLAGLMDLALATAPPADLPTLILYGARDEIIPKQPTCRWLQAIPAEAAVRLTVYAEGWHMLTRDLQAATVLEDLATWLGNTTSSLPSRAEVRGRSPEFCG